METRYSRTSPPLDEESALLRIDTLNVNIGHIQAKLDTKVQENFDSHENFLRWQNRATRALAHSRVEHAYLKDYLEKQKLASTLAEASPAQAAGVHILESIATASIKSYAYAPVFSADEGEADPLALTQRFAEVADLKNRIQLDLGRLRTVSVSTKSTKNSFQTAKNRLLAVLCEVEKEARLIKNLRQKTYRAESQLGNGSGFSSAQTIRFLLGVIADSCDHSSLAESDKEKLERIRAFQEQRQLVPV